MDRKINGTGTDTGMNFYLQELSEIKSIVKRISDQCTIFKVPKGPPAKEISQTRSIYSDSMLGQDIYMVKESLLELLQEIT